MEAWLLFPVRLFAVTLIAFLAYSVCEQARLPLVPDSPSDSALHDDLPAKRPKTNLVAISVAVGLLVFATALFVGESLMVRRFRKTQRQIESLGGSIRFDPPHDFVWAALFFSSATVDLSDTVLDESTVVDFASIPGLKTLRLANTRIGETVIVSLVKCKTLTGLDLSNTNLRDDDLRCLPSFRNLQNLILNDTSVSDDCIDHLSASIALKELQCAGTRISDRGIETLRDLGRLVVRSGTTTG